MQYPISDISTVVSNPASVLTSTATVMHESAENLMYPQYRLLTNHPYMCSNSLFLVSPDYVMVL